MFYSGDGGAVPPQPADGARRIRVVDDQIVRVAAGNNQAMLRAVGQVFHALLGRQHGGNVLLPQGIPDKIPVLSPGSVTREDTATTSAPV